MTPAFLVLADGINVTAAIAARLLKLTVTDERGVESDGVEILVDDRNHAVALPRRGALLAVSMGYQGGLAPMGLFTVDEVSIDGPPWQVGIKGRAADLRDDFKAQKSRHFEATTLGAIFGRIASEHGLAAAVDPALASREVPYVAQTAESDLAFMTRLARRHDATAKPAAGKLVVVQRGAGLGASGLVLPPAVVSPGMVTKVSVTLRDRPQRGAVSADWHDRAAGRRETETMPSGGEGPTMALPHAYPSRDEAQRAAETRGRELGRAEGSLSVEMPGSTAIFAERPVIMAGFRDGIDGLWTVTQAEHTIDGGGYRTSFTSETGEGGGDEG